MKILIAEDDPVSCKVLEAKLVNWGYDVVVTRDGNEAWQAMQGKEAPRLAILDWMMPGIDGVEVCQKVRKQSEKPYTYIILLTALDQVENLVLGMDAGADDYIRKPVNENELRVRLRAGRRMIDLQDELIAARENFREKSIRDPLTGLWNHEEILRILDAELVRADREGRSVCAIMADIDHFKKVNDTYGHPAGDAVLRMVARKMLSIVRPYDSIGRYGGEEFLIVMPGFECRNAAAFAERLRLCIATGTMDTSEGIISISVSLGVAESHIKRRLDANSLVLSADSALYQAKGKGRDCVEVASFGET